MGEGRTIIQVCCLCCLRCYGLHLVVGHGRDLHESDSIPGNVIQVSESSLWFAVFFYRSSRCNFWGLEQHFRSLFEGLLHLVFVLMVHKSLCELKRRINLWGQMCVLGGRQAELSFLLENSEKPSQILLGP